MAKISILHAPGRGERSGERVVMQSSSGGATWAVALFVLNISPKRATDAAEPRRRIVRMRRCMVSAAPCLVRALSAGLAQVPRKQGVGGRTWKEVHARPSRAEEVGCRPSFSPSPPERKGKNDSGFPESEDFSEFLTCWKKD
ncbi:hypothetical protein GGTG_10080 [Gaeumannomyces tritici R3-111a-1]|uniref:Uncharacterized protein n=1 Tax=Gaeumannomyces tritici (strain R3-111a-1) TaxID=644352 RepID=J3P997_GAET3|nr:hypothetical protein GGTG_10080 [Gaeumannomyces tritici R3-111a-1]EJT73233.1 hypothetical protein GGTG_10080 [Gaeumannomyces tritici R3-111a-1]